MKFFHHRLLEHSLLASLLEILSTTNVVVRWRRRKRRRCGEWLLVERVLQNRFHALVAASSRLEVTIGGRFHPGRRVLFGKPDDAQTRSVAHLRMWLLGEDPRKELRGVRSELLGPAQHA